MRLAGQMVYFAHVPKYAGAAVLQWLQEAFRAPAFHDTEHLSLITSLQHADHKTLSRLFPDGSFDGSLAVVTHPLSRRISAFRFQRDIEEIPPANTEISNGLAKLDAQKPWQHDNHLPPMDDIARIANLHAFDYSLETWRVRT